MSLIKKLGYASLLVGTMFLSAPTKSALTNPEIEMVGKPRNVKVEDEYLKANILDRDGDGILDMIIIRNKKNVDKGRTVIKNTFTSKNYKGSLKKYFKTFKVYYCEKDWDWECINVSSNKDVENYQKILFDKR
jgi:translation initiation factor 2 beta subunit (eIF-2beta)/eIF-5|tara:strand:+ start:251 stop:649 length:399 start_codon:yes stop_codon:yes gene_type:complete